MNGTQALYGNPSYFKWISGINLSPANKRLFTISFGLYAIWIKTKCHLIMDFFNGVLRHRLLNNSFPCCSFINLDFLLSHQ